MVKAEWGTKRTCPKCGTRFYDLGKDEPATCIECGEEWEPEPVLKTKQPIPFDDDKKKGGAADSDLADDEDDELSDVDEDENRPDSDVDLGDDSQDMAVSKGKGDDDDQAET